MKSIIYFKRNVLGAGGSLEIGIPLANMMPRYSMPKKMFATALQNKIRLTRARYIRVLETTL